MYVRVLIVVFGVLTLAFPLAFFGEFVIARQFQAANSDVTRLRGAQVTIAQVLRAQVDEETGIRGYLLGRDATFLEPYRRASADLPQLLGQLQADLGTLDGSRAHLDAIAAVNERWQREIAAPALAGKRRPGDAARGRTLVNAVRTHAAALETLLQQQLRSDGARRDRIVLADETLGYATALISLGEAALFAMLLSSLRRALDRERGIVDVLQAATMASRGRNTAFEVGSAYASATRGSRVGGDLFDVFPLDDSSAMIALGDVSGKGVHAAVEASTLRDVLRAYAYEAHDPAEIVTRLNALYHAEGRAPEAFVTLFVGIADARRGTLVYTSAGHEAAYVRRAGALEWLPPTDAVIGIDATTTFSSRTVLLGPRDMVVLATDGVTEARDPNGAFLADGSVAAWIAASPAATPQQLVDDLLARVHRWTRRRAADDLALLALRPRPQLRS